MGTVKPLVIFALANFSARIHLPIAPISSHETEMYQTTSFFQKQRQAVVKKYERFCYISQNVTIIIYI